MACPGLLSGEQQHGHDVRQRPLPGRVQVQVVAAVVSGLGPAWLSRVTDRLV